jgi:putative transposase
MPRKLRLVYENAIYHVINRGNYRSNVFTSEGAAQAFEKVMFEAVKRYGWKLQAYVVMRNHFHLAITTPTPNLVAGMQWLQSTYAARFNRFRGAQGHLFQGRYKAQVVEPGESLARVVNYIHLNPVRAKLVEPTQVAIFRWSSLRRFVKPEYRRPEMEAASWLLTMGRADDPAGWADYIDWLVKLGANQPAQRREGLTELSRGWALGTQGWKQAMAQEYEHLALYPAMEKEQAKELLEVRCRQRLEKELAKRGKDLTDAAKEQKGVPWKIEIARILREDGLASNGWIARELNMGHPRAVSSYLRIGRGQNMTYDP